MATPAGSADGFPKLPPPPTGSTQPTGSNANANGVAANRLKQTQAQVDEVVGIMRVNVEKVLERDQKLSELDQRADALQHGASQFEQQAGKLKRKQWWANMKMMIIMGIIGVVLLIIIILSIIY
ncbi:synaptobrevin isoform X2 [Ochlerotatus camptorhynchus]|uniref:synaptobrevin isoform X2 n=1 Tax=Ochlerotatus camptorhynchus TaxID=644619 RepID=UPI0031E28E8B